MAAYPALDAFCRDSNAIMVGGTGMCGGCRVSVGGQMRFACVHGPKFDGHQVDWDELVARQRFYQEEERQATEEWKGACQLTVQSTKSF